MASRILITGAAGFIGHHFLSYVINHTDWEVVCLDRLDFSGNLNRISEIVEDLSSIEKSRIKIVYHDLKAEINSMLSSDIGSVDKIFHLAASSHVDRSIADPMGFVMDNVVGTVNLLQYARKLPDLRLFVYFSTDEIFGPAPGKIFYKEYDRYNSTNPYSASKAAGEEMCVAFQNTYNLPIAIVHTMNVFGERQHPEKFIPLCVKRILSGQEIIIHADETLSVPGSRHYIHAQDVAEGLMFINKLDLVELNQNINIAKCQKFNLVGPEEIDNLSLAKMIATSLDREFKYRLVDFHSSRPGHDLRYALDGSYMRSLGWSPSKILRDEIHKLSNWFASNPRWLIND